MLVQQAQRPSSTPLLQRAASAPRAFGRATRRWSHAAGLTANIASGLRRIEQCERNGHNADRQRLSFQQWLANNVCAIHGIEVEVSGRVDLLGGDLPCVTVANHISYLDPIAILSRVSAFAIAKREVSSWPLVGQLATQLGMIPYARGDAFDGARVLRQCEQHLRCGHRVLAFPEGTTTRGNDVVRFHRGAFFLARHCQVPLLPIVVRYDSADAAWVGDDTFLPHYMRTTMRPVTRVRLDVLAPVQPDEATSSDGLCAAVQTRFATALAM
jgi:1-acyl-sn-glycerol-3-phosphate acyltransferase